MGFEWLAHKDYKRHYICLNCQKGFKRPPLSDMKEEELVKLSVSMEKFYDSNISMDILEYIKTAAISAKSVCPQCQGALIQVPYTFEVPAKSKKKEWKVISLHYTTRELYGLCEPFYYWHLDKLAKTEAASTFGKRLRSNKEKLEKYIRTH